MTLDKREHTSNSRYDDTFFQIIGSLVDDLNKRKAYSAI